VPTMAVGDLEVVWDGAGPQGADPVVLINGLGAARDSWFLQVEALSRNYRVYTYDNRDVGETGAGTNPRRYDMDQFARDAVGLIDALEIGPVHVIGASMGGAIAEELALQRPDLLRTLQIGCSWAQTDAWLDELIRQWQLMFAELGPLAWTRNSWLWVFTHRWYRDPDRLAGLVADASAYQYPQTSDMFNRQCEAVIAFDVLDRLGTISTPTQVIAGAEDFLIPPRFSQEIAATIPGAKLTQLPNVGHGMFWETPETFNTALTEFIEDSWS
jgi:pimeloyl-ACP methyl ester carboxylesterase